MLRKPLFIFFFFCGIFFFHTALFSQVARFKHISVDDGLSQNSISCIVQDKKGFIWIGTYDGLNKFDGYKITQYTYAKDSNCVSGSLIRCIYPDDENNLWIGSSGGGLSRFDMSTSRFTNYMIDSTKKNGIASNAVMEIAEFRKGKLYLATQKGLNIFDKKSGEFTLLTHSDKDSNSVLANPVRTMTMDKRGHIWLGHNGYGLTEYIPETNTFIRYRPKTGSAPKSHLFDSHIRNLYADKDGLIWISLWNSGVNIYDTKTGLFHHSHDQSGPLEDISRIGLVSQFYQDNNGNMWLCTAEEGLVKYNRKSREVTSFKNDPNDPESMSDNINFCVLEDRSGLIWAGTWKGGVNYFDPRSLNFGYFKHESNKQNTLNHNNVYAFYDLGNDELLIGNGGGANYFNTKNKTFTPFPINLKDENSLLPQSVVSDIIKYTDGSIWFSTGGGGVYRYYPKTKRYKNYNTTDDPNSFSNHTPNCFILDNENNLWISTLGGGLNLYNPDKDNFTRFVYSQTDKNTPSSNYIAFLVKDKEGNIWMGTSGAGLTLLDPKTRTFKRIYDTPGKNPLPDIGVSAIHFDKAGKAWIGTSGGLCSMDPKTKEVKNYANENPLLKPEFYSILSDTFGNLWMPSDKGLVKFDPVSGKAKVFTKEDGVQGKEFNPASGAKLKDGKLLMGGINGFNFFDPAKIIESTNPPIIAFTNFQVLNKPYRLPKDISLTNEITLSYRDYFFSFDVAALDFKNPQLNSFKYMLEGFNDEWVDIGHLHTLTFTNLDHGTYTLKVIAGNSGGFWNETPLTLQLTITPPFWKTKWFYVLCILCGGLLIYAYIRYREKKLKEEKLLLEKKVEERTEELNLEKLKVEEAHKDIKDSILYAQKIQSAIIPTENDFKRSFPSSFVLFKPKDIVSGDFYWISEKTDYTFFVIADCTGHGVPGGFMTMLGAGLLNEIVNELNITEPAAILNKLREKIINSLKQTGRSGENKDGMDLVLFRISKTGDKLCYAAANNGFMIVNNKAHTDYSGDKQPVGIYGDDLNPFHQFDVQLKKGDIIYSFTDGFPDQFGGPKGKKFKYKALHNILISNSDIPFEQQKDNLNAEFSSWKGGLEQIDDVCIIGIRV